MSDVKPTDVGLTIWNYKTSLSLKGSAASVIVIIVEKNQQQYVLICQYILIGNRNW